MHILIDGEINCYTEEDFLYIKSNYLGKQIVKCSCPQCGQNYTRKVQRLKWPTTCKSCSLKNSKKSISDSTREKLKIAVKRAMNDPLVKEKIRHTMMQRYGIESYTQSDDFKNKAEKTIIDRYGSRHNAGVEQFKNWKNSVSNEDYQNWIDSAKKSREKTNFERFGVKCNLQSEDTKEKSRLSMLKRFGVENSMQSEEVKSKARETYKKHLGVDNPFKSEAVKNKAKYTMIKRYGAPSWQQSDEGRAFFRDNWVNNCKDKIKHKSYSFDGCVFDSSWELAYYIWLKDHSIQFTFHSERFEYFDSNGYSHFYYPDFNVCGNIVEIKGDHLMDCNGNVLNNDKTVNMEKSILMRELGVYVIHGEEAKKYIKYVCDIYGDSFLGNCKNE